MILEKYVICVFFFVAWGFFGVEYSELCIIVILKSEYVQIRFQ